MKILFSLMLLLFGIVSILHDVYLYARSAERKAILEPDTPERKRIKKAIAEEVFQEVEKITKEKMEKVTFE